MITTENFLSFNAIPSEIAAQYRGSTPDWAVKARTENDYQVFSYVEGLPLEPVIQRFDENNWVTVNRYGARCLNSKTLFMADVDFSLLSVWCEIPLSVEAKWGSEDRQAIYLGNELLGKGFTQLSHFAHKESLRFEIITTLGGLRVLETSQPYYLPGFWGWLEQRAERGSKAWHEYAIAWENGDKTGFPYTWHPDGKDLLFWISNDRRYKELCLTQKCFRHRLDPKPWRSEPVVGLNRVVIGTADRHPSLEPLLEAYDQLLGLTA